MELASCGSRWPDLMDHAPETALLTAVEDAARSVEGVKAVEKLRMRKAGMDCDSPEPKDRRRRTCRPPGCDEMSAINQVQFLPPYTVLESFEDRACSWRCRVPAACLAASSFIAS